MSYELKISEKDRVAGRFISSVRKSLFMAVFDHNGRSRMSQQFVANKLGVHRSAINRILRGDRNLTLRSAAEIAWALGYKPNFSLIPEYTADAVGINATSRAFVDKTESTPVTNDNSLLNNLPIVAVS